MESLMNADSAFYAMLTALLGLITFIIQQLRKNKQEASQNVDQTAEILRRIQGLEHLINKHIDWHMERISSSEYQQERRRQGHRGGNR